MEKATRTTTMMSPESARKALIDAAACFTDIFATDRKEQALLALLQNKVYRDVFATCVNETVVMTAFTWAASSNDVELLQAFYNIGMSVDVKSDCGYCALTNACLNGHEESVRWLLDHNADVDVKDCRGCTPLMNASVDSRQRTRTLEMILEKGVNVDEVDNCGTTALMFASRANQKEIVQLLLKANADVDLKDEDGETALDMARSKEVRELLLNHVNTSYVLK